MKSIEHAAPRLPGSALAPATWRSDIYRSIARDPCPPSRFPDDRRWATESACRELLRRLAHSVDDRLAFAAGIVEPARLGIVVDHQRPVVDPDQLRAGEGIAANDAFARLL